MVDQYIFSGSLPENASTYVTRDADGELYDGLQAGKFCYVLNSRQSGKSSLRVRTMRRLRENGVECAAIDLSAGGIQNVPPEQWYADLIDSLIDCFDLDVDFEEWWEENKLNSLVTRFRKFLEEILLVEIKENIVIFIDEIDSVLSLDFPTDDFFAFIRSCYNQRVDNPAYNRLTFCLLGVASPSNLIQDKQRTPFNIGKAISLKGFQLHEVEPLEKGFRGKFNDSQAVIKEILNWTKGQPFLTQKLCQFMVEESEKENPRTVEEVVKSKIIENWESQDEPEHLRTIRARILRNEERAGYLLDLYQQVRCSEVESEITADNTIEQSELLLSGLVARREGKLKVYNLIYKQVFNNNWVENELKNLRPYSESFKFWVASGGKDESRLLRGKALVDAEEWGKDKNFSYQDKQFLAASREKEIQEKIAVDEQAAKLERERKDKEAVEKRNLVLSEANQKAKQRIRNGTVVLSLALLGTVTSITVAGKQVLEAQNKVLEAQNKVSEAQNKLEKTENKLEKAYIHLVYPQKLRKLAEKLPSDSEEANEISEKADIQIKEPQLEQIYLYASQSLAYQYLEDWESAEESIKQSMKFLKGWELNNEKEKHNKSNHEFLQIKMFALTVQANLFKQQNNTQKAITVYQEAFNILIKRKINPFKPEFYILDHKTVESLHRGFIELFSRLGDRQKEYYPLLFEVKNSRIKHFYDALKYSLEKKNWREADKLTDKLMLFIANTRERDYLSIKDIENFSCSYLKRIDNYWVQNSGGRFGLSLQKQIWKDTGNRLSITEFSDEDRKSYELFLSRVGWYDREKKVYPYINYGKVIKVVEKDYQQAPMGSLPLVHYIPSQPYYIPSQPLPAEKAYTLFSRAATCKL